MTSRGSGFVAVKQKITVGEFREFVRRTGYLTDCEKHDSGWILLRKRWVKKPDASWDNPYRQQDENEPVVLVSWYDAVSFANWKSACEGLSKAYTFIHTEGHCAVEDDPAADGYRLPTETEWEKAARAGLVEMSLPTSGCEGKLKPNNDQRFPAGLWSRRGLASNTLEWCWDSGEPAPACDETEQTRSNFVASRICRGAGVVGLGVDDSRGACDPFTATTTLGFRLMKWK